ncbi:MAG: nucleotidyltransferase domain-containing protein [Gemmatimonadaceae bacterium]|nr:nucleotidyltransferase domain-containing protein [Gemmatimonadaceae bacterium]
MATMTLDELVQQLRKAFGDELRAVVLYGSAAAGEHIAKRSDYNVLVLVDALDLEHLDREAAIARAWAEGGNPPPLTLTVDEWRSSSDIFPMEYADILERHRVLYGTPPFDGIRVERSTLRLQLEYQAMAKLLQLRQGVLAAGRDRRRLVELLAASLSTFMVIFRAVLRYHGETPPTDYEALSARITARTGVATDPFVRVVRHVRGSERITESDVTTVLASYLASVQHLVHYLDRQGTS